MKLSFTVHGKPIAKQRVRHYVRKGSDKASTYTPQETVIYESLVAMEAIAAMKKQKVERFSGAVSVSLNLFFPIAETRKKRIKEGEWHLQRPDIDNCKKSVLDGCNLILWSDDCTVCHIEANKYWTHEQPRAEITVESLEPRISASLLANKECLENS